MGFSSTSYGHEGEYGFDNEPGSPPIEDPTTFYDPNNPYGQPGFDGGYPTDTHVNSGLEDQTVALAPGGYPQLAYYGAEVQGHQQPAASYARDQFAQQAQPTSGPLNQPQTYNNQQFQPSGYHYEPGPPTFGDRLENLLGTSNRRLSAGIVVASLIAVAGLFFVLGGNDGTSSDIRATGGDPNGLPEPSIGDITVPTASVAVLAENNDQQSANANAAASQTTIPLIEETTTVPETTTSLETTTLLETTSSLVEPSSSLGQTLPVSTISSLPTSSSSPTTSTLPTSSTIPNPTSATLTPGGLATGGVTTPVGTYSGVVPQGPGCNYSVSATRPRQRSADPGETISFTLGRGDRVVIEVGCPTNFTVS